MSTTQTKTDLVRLAWITELRRQGDRKCKGHLFAKGSKVCAIALLSEVAGLPKWKTYELIRVNKGEHAIGRLAGLDDIESCNVWRMNDSGFTFAEIADAVAAWFSEPRPIE